MADTPASQEFSSGLLKSLVKATQVSNTLPAADDHDFACSYPAYASSVRGFGERLSGMMQGFLAHQLSPHVQVVPVPEHGALCVV